VNYFSSNMSADLWEQWSRLDYNDDHGANNVHEFGEFSSELKQQPWENVATGGEESTAELHLPAMEELDGPALSEFTFSVTEYVSSQTTELLQEGTSSLTVTGGAMASLSLVPESSATWQPPTVPHMAVVTTLDQPGIAYELTTSGLSYASSELTTEIYTSWAGDSTSDGHVTTMAEDFLLRHRLVTAANTNELVTQQLQVLTELIPETTPTSAGDSVNFVQCGNPLCFWTVTELLLAVTALTGNLQ
jgi:hypothetical protein